MIRPRHYARLSPQTSDEELLELLHRGETQAFDELFNRYERRLFGYLRRMVPDAQTAEDLFQDIFCKVLSDRSFDARRGRFSAWLFGVARNRCLMHLRSEATRQDKTQAHAQAHAIQAPLKNTDFNPEEKLVRNDRVEAAMESLPEPQRQLLILKQVGELTYAELATMLGVAEGTIKSRLFSATRAFRKRLTELGEI